MKKRQKKDWKATGVGDTPCTSEARRAKKKWGEFIFTKAKLFHQHEQVTGSWDALPGSQRSLGRAESTEGESVDIRAEVQPQLCCANFEG